MFEHSTVCRNNLLLKKLSDEMTEHDYECIKKQLQSKKHSIYRYIIKEIGANECFDR